jgi:hypothetical protein
VTDQAKKMNTTGWYDGFLGKAARFLDNEEYRTGYKEGAIAKASLEASAARMKELFA